MLTTWPTQEEAVPKMPRGRRKLNASCKRTRYSTVLTQAMNGRVRWRVQDLLKNAPISDATLWRHGSRYKRISKSVRSNREVTGGPLVRQKRDSAFLSAGMEHKTTN